VQRQLLPLVHSMSTDRLRFSGLLLVVIAALAAPSLRAQNASDARVLRLTLAQGDVQVNPNTGVGWQQAIQNMPVPAGSRVWAARDSIAVVELEDGSTIRLIGPAEIVLNQLSLAADGAAVDRVEVDAGLVYINADLPAHADFRIQDPNGKTFALTQASELSFEVDGDMASVSVMHGQVKAENLPGNPVIRSGHSFDYSVAPE
jgi:ferric-dicitrate binding protein FerR (iron transport regulator)